MIRKGGKGVVALMEYGGTPILNFSDKPTLDYFSLNTTIDFKYRIREAITPFIGFGPRFDYLLNSSKHFDELKKLGEFNDISFGLILGGGLKYDISDFQFGLRADYYLDFKKFKKIAEWTIEDTGMGGKISVNTFTLNLSVGYRLR
jgi:opacity protein-like surface antigen